MVVVVGTTDIPCNVVEILLALHLSLIIPPFIISATQ